MAVTVVIQIITGGSPLTSPKQKIQKKRRKEKNKKKRSPEVKLKDTYLYHKLPLPLFKSVCLFGFCYFSFALVDFIGYKFEFARVLL